MTGALQPPREFRLRYGSIHAKRHQRLEKTLVGIRVEGSGH